MPDYSGYSHIELMGLCAWKEARSDGASGCTAVMHVILNRATDWGQSIPHVILMPYQFTPMTDPADNEYELFPAAGDTVYKSCLAEAQAVLSYYEGKAVPDHTRKAHYYANLDYIDKGGWFQRFILDDPKLHPFTVKVGQQSFFF